MLNKLIDRIKEIAQNAVKFPPENRKELQNFLIAWYCNRYNIPFTSEKVEKLEFETLLLEFYLFDTWKKVEENIKNGKYEAEAQAQEDEEWLKEQMGEDYHDEIDYLQEPTKTELDKKKQAPDNLPPDIDEDFSVLGED